MIAAAIFFGQYVRRQQDLKISHGWVPAEGEIRWTSKSVLIFPMISIAAGVIGGLLGLGGGIIIGPLLLEMGVDVSSRLS